MIKILNYIDGEFSESLSKQWVEVYDPSKGVPFGLAADSDANDLQLAVTAANKAFDGWSKTPAEIRAKYLQQIGDKILEKLEPLAQAESMDQGKPLSLAKNLDIPRAASNFHFFSSAIVHFASEAHAMEQGAINYTLRKPIGIVGCISPWNLPLYLFSWKIAPALAAGNCVIAKPSEITPYTAYLLAKICDEIKLPKGVLNIVHGQGAKIGNAISAHPLIKAISFTGGTTTGKTIASIAAPLFKKLSLELGGKNPAIIFDDCEYDTMLETVVRSSFLNQGEICLCSSRILVQDTIYEKFKSDFVRKVNELKVGIPSQPDTTLGAIVSEAHLKKVLFYIDLAQQEGGTILCGGKQLTMQNEYSKGWYLQPTVIEGLSNTCRTNQEEIFGPVVTLIPFKTEEEAITLANGTDYGLAASVWTSHLQRSKRLSSALDFGIVWVNCWLLRDLRTPFGGVKNSGVGREGGWEALKFFTETKNICEKY